MKEYKRLNNIEKDNNINQLNIWEEERPIILNKDRSSVLIKGDAFKGKANLIHTVLLNILQRYSKEDLKITLIDFTTVEFKNYNKIANVMLVDSENLELQTDALRMIRSEILRRKTIFRGKCENIEFYRSRQKVDRSLERLPNNILIINNISDNILENNEILNIIQYIVEDGGKYGVYSLITDRKSNIGSLDEEFSTVIKTEIPSSKRRPEFCIEITYKTIPLVRFEIIKEIIARISSEDSSNVEYKNESVRIL